MTSGNPEISAGLRRDYVLVLAPPAFLAPLPLLWTGGASGTAILLYEAALLFLWVRARSGSPVRLSATLLNLAGLLYFFWLGVEVTLLRRGLLSLVCHLLLFTALAKLASLKHAGEARMALLVLFLVTLASASSSTHVASLLYFAAMAILAFRALSRLAVLADFEEAPPDRVLRSVPTGGVAAAALAGAALLAAPLFYALPRLQAPYAVPRFRTEEAFSSALSADRVDIESFAAAKRSDRIVLRLTADPPGARSLFVRLREAVFTEYRAGSWTRRPYSGRVRPRLPLGGPGARTLARASIDLNLFGPGFLFLPYAAADLDIERSWVAPLPDGVVQATRARSLRYAVSVQRLEMRGPGESAIDPASVPREIRDYALELTGELEDPGAIAARIQSHLARDFVYSLNAPQRAGDPVVSFLTRSKAGHCEHFASAAALMLAAREIPARLVTGSYGGEVALLSEAVIVRGGNLHAWVEADLDGKGFSIFDPTPPAGIPPASSRVSLLNRLATLGREIEFFYDRRILGFDSLDQGQLFSNARESLGNAGEALSAWRLRVAEGSWRKPLRGAALLVAAALAFLLFWRRRSRVPTPAATKAYLALRHLLSRRMGGISPAVPPAAVARLFADCAPEGAEDARTVVETYCASAFGGLAPDAAAEQALTERVRRLRKLG